MSAYVTFVYKEDAKASIQSLEGYWLDGHLLRASFGTTKYCNNFIRGVACNNPDCVYLHELGEDEDRFTKEEIQVCRYDWVPVGGGWWVSRVNSVRLCGGGRCGRWRWRRHGGKGADDDINLHCHYR